MGTVELVIIALISTFAVFSILFIFFKKKKTKKENKESGKEKKIEPVYKSDKNEGSKDKGEEKGEDEQKKEAFKIVRKQAEVKISKKALSSESRNPSITKVFGKDAVKEKPQQDDEGNIGQEEKIKVLKIKKEVERFGVKEYEYSETNTADNFKINAPEGSPSRSFELNRRSFGSHLNISEDGNLGGVVGIGLNKAVDQAESQLDDIEQKNERMISRAQNILGANHDGYKSIESRLRQVRDSMQDTEQKQTDKNILKDIDAKTLIVAEAISNPKYKNYKNVDGGNT